MKPQLHAQWYALQLQWQKSILAVYRSANPDHITEGIRWYPFATSTLAELRLTSGVPITAEAVAAICAVLSPRITWQSNIEGVRRILRAKRQGTRVPPVVAGLMRNADKAWDIANGGSLDQVTGPKVSAFYANLTGNLQRVTIDVWAARAAGVDDSAMTHLDRYRYVYLERAYQAVVAEIGFQCVEVQALCWIVVRGQGE